MLAMAEKCSGACHKEVPGKFVCIEMFLRFAVGWNVQ